MRVKGDILDVQSNLDFYLKITSTGGIKTVEGLRKHFYKIFLQEEREQTSLLLEEKVELEKRKEGEKLRQEELEKQKVELENENSVVNSNSFLSAVQSIGVVEPESEVNSNSFLSAVNNLGMVESESGDFDYNDIDIGESNDDFDYNSIDIGEPIEGFDNEEYISHGIYLDELPDEKPTEKSIETVEELSDGEEYVSHGIYLDELPDEEVDMVQEEPKKEEVQEPMFSSEDIDALFEESFNAVEESIGKLQEEENSKEDTKESESMIEEIPEEGIVITEKPNLEIEEEKLEVSKDEEPENIPRDIRDFLRQHPGSEILYVQKFYPKKEIEKQIKLGRIYKKRGKLFI